MKEALVILAAVGLAGCSHVPFFSGKNYYKQVQTKSGNVRLGQTAIETRELFCPAGRLGDKEDPSSWSDQELFDHLKSKTCLRVICHTDQFTSNQCVSSGDETLQPELLRMRDSRTVAETK